ncbi:MAG: hypothetical protein HPY66_3045 [Firmicutes bacterium]|nr:hypothetical protein [Bacillota bacterium]
MLKALVYSAIKNRKLTLFVVGLSIIFGLYSYYATPKQEAPDLDAPVAVITVVYPGASPEDVEKCVTSKIEDEIVEISGYGYAHSYSGNSISTVIMRLEYGTDIDSAWTELRRRMNDLQVHLPDECTEIQVNTNLVDTAGFILSVSGDGYTGKQLEEYARDIKKELGRVQGVSRIDILGAQDEEVVVEVDVGRLNYCGLSLEDIANIIKVQNAEIPAGSIGEGGTRINVTVPGAFTSIGEIENTIVDVSVENGSVLRLGDIASVTIKPGEKNVRTKHNGRNAVLLSGYFKQDENIVLSGKKVENRIIQLAKELPEGVDVEKVLFQPEDVRKSVNSFALNLLEGMIFVIIVVFAGMGLRNAIVVSTAIPVSILITLIAMYLLGIKIHQISIAALIVALGMLVDNAIVISDAIQNRMDRGDGRMDACVEGVREVAAPVFTSTLTTICAFMPLLFLSSIAGEYISSLPKIVMTALFSSYMIALFVTPTLAFIFFRQGEKSRREYRIRGYFRSMLETGMERERTMLKYAVPVILLTALMVSQLGLQFFPRADKNIIYIDVKTERNSGIDTTEGIVDRVSEILGEQPEVTGFTAAIGGGLPKFYNTTPVVTASPDTGQIMVTLDLKKGGRFRKNSEITDYLQEIFDSRITGGTVSVKQLEIAEPIGSPIRVRITGRSMQELREASQNIKGILSAINGTVNVEDDYSEKAYEYRINIDNDKASYFGISKLDVQREVSIAVHGLTASVYREAGDDLDIIVKSSIKRKEDLDNLAIKSSITSDKITLREIAEIVLEPQIQTIKKYDRNLAVMVTSDVRSGYNPIRIQKRLTRQLDKMDMKGVEIMFDGEKEKIAENFGNIGTSAIFAVMLVFAVLLFEFKSFIQSLVILITIPLSVVGSVLGLYIFRQPLSFTALFGMVSLMGIVVNNAIVLVDYINNERKLGKGISEACIQAADKRFRPIMLSTVTTVTGLIPLVLSGSEMFRPMAISLMFGLTLSTLLTLVVIPVAYKAAVAQIKP